MRFSGRFSRRQRDLVRTGSYSSFFYALGFGGAMSSSALFTLATRAGQAEAKCLAGQQPWNQNFPTDSAEEAYFI
jgi:hypothetical protein